MYGGGVCLFPRIVSYLGLEWFGGSGDLSHSHVSLGAIHDAGFKNNSSFVFVLEAEESAWQFC